jgi:hypothetical protein
MIDIIQKATGTVLLSLNPEIFEVANSIGVETAVVEPPKPKFVVTTAGSVKTVDEWVELLGEDAALAAGLIDHNDDIPNFKTGMESVGVLTESGVKTVESPPTTTAPQTVAPPPAGALTESPTVNAKPPTPDVPSTTSAAVLPSETGVQHKYVEGDVPVIPGRECIIRGKDFSNVVDATNLLYDTRIHAVSRDHEPTYKKDGTFKSKARTSAEVKAAVETQLREGLAGVTPTTPASAETAPNPETITGAVTAPPPPPGGEGVAPPPTIEAGVDGAIEQALSAW